MGGHVDYDPAMLKWAGMSSQSSSGSDIHQHWFQQALLLDASPRRTRPQAGILEMHNNRPKHFRFNNKAARFTFVMVAAIPAAVLALGFWSEGKYELRGKRRGDVIKEF
ncbi:hypothetical protein H072_2785 [Dactylellina haptotyla CBS 200.50]|uniref:NADH dehydrogenase [ubiquinone] 1 beta subcomplex subunit 4 n=1 Tax=Dactylellina haptotyla (strain CBS 200.50) TaxID=1284197 RepID=S8AK32_DACHA|nr:hypothetical protein H072_2785 [Dactylellina haptotyla CBS 200.50]